jgi:hypothetical protein
VYDRMSWGWFPKVLSVAAGSSLVVLLTVLILRPPLDEPRWQVARALPLLVDSTGHRLLRDDQLVEAQHLVSPRESIVRITLRGDLAPELLDTLHDQFSTALAEAATDLAGNRIELMFLPAEEDILHPEHMAHLGAELFSRHLLAIELIGTALLAALIGAVSIVSHGSPRHSPAKRGTS